MASFPNNCWEAHKSNFNSVPHQLEDWRFFYTKGLDYQEVLNINNDEADDQHTGWKQLKMMFKGEDRQTLQSLINNGTMPVEHQKMLWEALNVMGISGISGMSIFPMSANSPIWVSMPSPPIYLPSLPSANSPIPKSRRCSESLSCNTQCDATRPETGSSSRTNPSSHTSPFLPYVNCLSCVVSSTRRPRKGDELTSLLLPQQPPQHPPFMMMPYPPTPAATDVAILTLKAMFSPGTVLLCLQWPRPLCFPVQVEEDPVTITQHSLMR